MPVGAALIVEDEPMVGVDMESRLKPIGLDVIVAASIDEALAAIEDRPIAVGILGYKLKTVSTASVGHALRERGIPFLVCSGVQAEEFEAVFEGVPFVGKPYKDEDLVRSVDTLLKSV